MTTNDKRISVDEVGVHDFVRTLTLVEAAEHFNKPEAYFYGEQYNPLLIILAYVVRKYRPNIYDIFPVRLGAGTCGDKLREIGGELDMYVWDRYAKPCGHWLTQAYWKELLLVPPVGFTPVGVLSWVELHRGSVSALNEDISLSMLRQEATNAVAEKLSELPVKLAEIFGDNNPGK